MSISKLCFYFKIYKYKLFSSNTLLSAGHMSDSSKLLILFTGDRTVFGNTQPGTFPPRMSMPSRSDGTIVLVHWYRTYYTNIIWFLELLVEIFTDLFCLLVNLVFSRMVVSTLSFMKAKSNHAGVKPFRNGRF